MKKKILHQIIQKMFPYVCTSNMTIVRMKCDPPLRMGSVEEKNQDLLLPV